MYCVVLDTLNAVSLVSVPLTVPKILGIIHDTGTIAIIQCDCNAIGISGNATNCGERVWSTVIK